jgi:L-fuculose-phosphate aldolase
MTEEMLAVTDIEGKPLNDRRASSQLALPRLSYRVRADARAVCHAHPPHGSAFAVAGLAIDAPILSEVILTLGCVPLAEYGTPSTDELTDAMLPLVKNHNALLMANHGAVAYGGDVWQAFDRLETLEHTAKIAILARALGGARDLPPDSIEKLIDIRERAGYLDERGRCQSCGYLHDTKVVCSTGERDPATARRASNGAGTNGKISLTREELIELLSQAARLSPAR